MVKKNLSFFPITTFVLIFISDLALEAEAEVSKRAWNSAWEVGISVMQAELRNLGFAEVQAELFWSTLA